MNKRREGAQEKTNIYTESHESTKLETIIYAQRTCGSINDDKN